MLNLQPIPAETQLDIDVCQTCRNNCGWSLLDTWMWSDTQREAVPLMVWVPCPDCNENERKPKPWDT